MPEKNTQGRGYISIQRIERQGRERNFRPVEVERKGTMTVLQGLIQLGFEPITEWIIKGSKIGPLGLDWEDHGGWLYAFVVDGEVKYIGLTDRVLRSRMGDYSHIKNTQTTGLREKIMTELSVGRRVHVFGWRQPDKSILIAEELRLRAEHRPPWNRI
jgi:hypothetical protein